MKMAASTRYKVAILGKNGYVGRELLRLVEKHPNLSLSHLASVDDCLQNSFELDAVFLATPADISMQAASALMQANASLRIIDLSGAFRLPGEVFTQWYEMPHKASFLIEKACYGLCPWATLQPTAQLIANPGCYATAALMALLPFFKANIMNITDEKSIIIDAKSGVSGSGKNPKPELMFCEMANNFYPYKIGKHQHVPEIEKAVADFSEQAINIRLTTSLLPIVRGLAMTIYLKASPSFPSDEAISEAIFNAFHRHYQSYPFVRFQEVGKETMKNEQKFLSLHAVIDTPYCHIGFFVKEGHITLFSSIDNLLKGAASQAIENFNALYQLPIETGLSALSL
jgi:N-acetyl-gamma-glutamyl-phosphate reductase